MKFSCVGSRVMEANNPYFINILQEKFHNFHPVATVLSYLTKAPLVSERFFSLRIFCILFCNVVTYTSCGAPFSLGLVALIGNSGTSWHSGGKCVGEAKGYAGKYHACLHWLSSRQQHDVGIQVRGCPRVGTLFSSD